MKIFLFISFLALVLTGCASGKAQKRMADRDRVSSQSKLYCDFVNGSEFNDVEIELNLQMARRCDSNKTFSITNYKTPSENVGIMYCCSLNADDKTAAVKKPVKKAEAVAKPVDPNAEVIEETAP